MIVEFGPAYRQQTIDLLLRLHAVTPFYQDLDVDQETIGEHYDFCSNNRSGFGRLILDRGRVAGLLAAYAAPLIFSRSLYTQDFGFFVLPDTPNRTKQAKQLIQLYVAWAKSVGAKSINLGVTLGIEDKSAGSLLRQCGFRCVSHTYELGG